MNKIEDIKELNYSKNIDLLLSLVSDQQKKSPSETLDSMAQSLMEIFFYVNNLQSNRWAFEEQIKQYKDHSISSMKRIKQLESEIERLKSNVDFLKDLSDYDGNYPE